MHVIQVLSDQVGQAASAVVTSQVHTTNKAINQSFYSFMDIQTSSKETR